MNLRLVLFSFQVAAFSALISLWMATQFVAWKFGGHPNLGAHWFWSDALGKVYAPWAIVRWWLLWGGSFPILKNAWVIAGALFVGCIFLSAKLWRGFQPSTSMSKIDAYPEVGKEEDLREVGLVRGGGLGERCGAVLGMLPSGRVITYAGDEPILSSGRTGSGKSAGYVIPTLLSVDSESAVVLDTKGELWQITGKHRGSLGPAFFFDPTHPDSACINILSEVRIGTRDEIRDISNGIAIFVDSAKGSFDSATSEFYHGRWMNLLLGIALHIVHDLGEELSLPAIWDKIADFQEKSLKRMLKSRDDMVRRKAAEFDAQSAGTKAGTLETAANLLAVFNDQLVREKTSTSDFAFNDLMTGEPTSIYIQARGQDAERLRPLTIMVLKALIKKNSFADFETDDGRRKIRPCRLVLEEIADASVKFIVDSMLTMRSRGFRVLAVTQSIKDLKRVYGNMQTIDAGCSAIIGYASVDKDEQQYFSDNSGQRSELVERVTREKGFFFSGPDKSVSVSTHKTPLLSRSDIRGLPKDRQILVVAGSSKVFVPHKVVWHKHPLFRDIGVNTHAAGFVDPGQSQWLLARRTKGAVIADANAVETDLAFVARRTGWSERELSEHVFGREILPRVVKAWVAGGRWMPKNHAETVRRVRREIEAMGSMGRDEVASRLLEDVAGLPAIRSVVS